MKEKLEEYGIDEDISVDLAHILETSNRAMEGDAFSRAKINRLEGDDKAIQNLISIIEDSDIDYAEELKNTTSLMRTLNNIRKEVQ